MRSIRILLTISPRYIPLVIFSYLFGEEGIRLARAEKWFLQGPGLGAESMPLAPGVAWGGCHCTCQINVKQRTGGNEKGALQRSPGATPSAGSQRQGSQALFNAGVRTEPGFVHAAPAI